MQNPKEVRTFRLDRRVLQMLASSARRHGVTENALAEAILERNLRIDSLVQTFDYIGVGKETFVSLLGMTDANGLDIAGSERGRRAFTLVKEVFESSDLELSFPRFLSEILGEQARWFRVEGTLAKPERMTLQHAYGAKWSVFLKAYLSGAYEVISRNKLELEASSDFVSVRLPRSHFQ